MSKESKNNLKKSGSNQERENINEDGVNNFNEDNNKLIRKSNNNLHTRDKEEFITCNTSVNNQNYESNLDNQIKINKV